MPALDRLLTRCVLGGFVTLFLAASPGCDPLRSRVARGQLVVVGLSPYDDFFRTVHREQLARHTWASERRDNRKGLVTSLGLLPDASSDVIIAALKGKGRSVPAAGVDGVAKAEIGRADRVESHAARLEDLANQGDDLGGRLRREVAASGKRQEAETELAAGVHELRELAIAERAHVRDARRFVSDLVEAVGAAAVPAAAPRTAPKRPMKPLPQRPPEPSGQKPADPKPPAGEVFTP